MTNKHNDMCWQNLALSVAAVVLYIKLN